MPRSQLYNSSRGAVVAVASRLAPMGRAIWSATPLIAALFAAQLAITGDAMGPWALVAIWSTLYWLSERLAAKTVSHWKEMSSGWRDSAYRALAELQRRDAASVSWADFIASVEANMPSEQHEAVRYAMALAWADHTQPEQVH